MSHKKIAKECVHKLEKDAKHYKKEIASEKKEFNEAKKGAQVLKKAIPFGKK
jgi:hypothetical protein